ncbi:hypothetical protein D3C78_1073240 [compost metagenome]
MRYTYDRSRHRVLVEQKVAAKRFSIRWDRAHVVLERLGKLEALLAEQLPREKVAAILGVDCQSSSGRSDQSAELIARVN